jgi:hypothetical protein
MEKGYMQKDPGSWLEPQSDVLKAFLEEQQFDKALSEIRGNSASFPAFQKRFWRWFNMFRILKFLHYAREHGFPELPVEQVARKFLYEYASGDHVPSDLRKESGSIYTAMNTREILKIFRERDRKPTP